MTRLSPIKQVIALAGWLILSFAAAGVGAVASVIAGVFYKQLLRPEWAPPAGRLWYSEPNAVSNAVDYASKQKHRGNACKDLVLGLSSNKTYPGPL
jgi:hypothetical protein